NLEDSTEYNIKIAANTYISQGQGRGPTAEINTATFHSAPTGKPAKLSFFDVTATNISISWENPDEEDINGPGNKYIVRYTGDVLDNLPHQMIV
ncbi:fibronectin type III domain-containing protein, partial [Salmonella sp. s51228]|uniref:fibronectin type III domain-containing protein n=1 Tax=Salmonella sp. s51228 TaxID=3159652 RepID=UPI00397F3BD5